MAEDALTVADLVATASLETEVLAGRDGLWRGVLWAHSCELPQPWRWLGPNELLMTVGLCVPEGAGGQVKFVRELSNAGLAGLMLGKHETCPEISNEMLAEANGLKFPVLMTAPEIPFAAVARHIAAASSTRQTIEVLLLAKLYSLAADSTDDLEMFANAVASLLRVGLRITDDLTGLPIVETKTPVRDGALESRSYEYSLRASEPATLTIEEPIGEDLSSLVLVHLMKLLEVNADRVYARAVHEAELGTMLFEGLTRGSRDATIETYLEEVNLSQGYRVVAVGAEVSERVRRAVALANLRVLTTARKGHGLLLVPRDVLERLQELLRGLRIGAGASSLFSDPRDVLAAASQAADAKSRGTDGPGWAEYQGVPISVLARSREEAREIVKSVLRELAEDTPKSHDLRETLFTYLRTDRSWNAAADELGIHRQTLGYRMKKIESITGLSLSSTEDLAALWIAYRSWDLLSGDAEV